MRVLSVKNIEYKLPSEWNELTTEQLLAICDIMLYRVNQDYKRLLMMSYFTDLSFKELRCWDTLALPEALAVFDYIFLSSKLTVNHFPVLKNMKGPEPGLTNFTFEQYFNESESYYYLTCKNGPGSNLDDLINVMYNYNGSGTNKGQLISLSAPTKLALFYFYEGSSNFIKNKFKPVFSSSSPSKSDGLEFARLLNHLNDGDLSRNEKIKNTNLYEALIYLEKIMNDGPK